MNNHPIILGLIQGIAEWLPVSSEGMIVLFLEIFDKGSNLNEAVSTALFLHLGTTLAAIIYFRKEIYGHFITLIKYKQANETDKSLIRFLFISTLITGVLGVVLLQVALKFSDGLNNATRIILVFVSLLLLITGLLQIKSRKDKGARTKITLTDAIILGIAQSFAVLPGLSRSGLTVSTFLLRKIDEEISLKLSFLMSIPIVIAGNILLNVDTLELNQSNLLSLVFSFVFGLLTIHVLLKLAKKVNFGPFVIGCAIIMLIAAASS